MGLDNCNRLFTTHKFGHKSPLLLPRASPSILLHDQTKSRLNLDRPTFARCKCTPNALANSHHNLLSCGIISLGPCHHHWFNGSIAWLGDLASLRPSGSEWASCLIAKIFDRRCRTLSDGSSTTETQALLDHGQFTGCLGWSSFPRTDSSMPCLRESPHHRVVAALVSWTPHTQFPFFPLLPHTLEHQSLLFSLHENRQSS